MSFSFGYSQQCRTKGIFGDTIYSCYCKLRLVISPFPLPLPLAGAERMKMFDFDNSRSLEKALSGKELNQKLLLLTKSTKSTKTTSQKL